MFYLFLKELIFSYNSMLMKGFNAYSSVIYPCVYDGPDIKLFILVGWDRSFSVAWPTGIQLVFFFCSGVSKLLGAQGLHRRAAYSICESLFWIHHGIYHDLFVCP